MNEKYVAGSGGMTVNDVVLNPNVDLGGRKPSLEEKVERQALIIARLIEVLNGNGTLNGKRTRRVLALEGSKLEATVPSISVLSDDPTD